MNRFNWKNQIKHLIERNLLDAKMHVIMNTFNWNNQNFCDAEVEGIGTHLISAIKF